MICVFIHLFASLLILVGGTGDTALSTHRRVPPLLLERHFQLKRFVAHHMPSYTKKYSPQMRKGRKRLRVCGMEGSDSDI